MLGIHVGTYTQLVSAWMVLVREVYFHRGTGRQRGLRGGSPESNGRNHDLHGTDAEHDEGPERRLAANCHLHVRQNS
jgi:hypothetical protein